MFSRSVATARLPSLAWPSSIAWSSPEFPRTSLPSTHAHAIYSLREAGLLLSRHWPLPCSPLPSSALHVRMLTTHSLHVCATSQLYGMQGEWMGSATAAECSRAMASPELLSLGHQLCLSAPALSLEQLPHQEEGRMPLVTLGSVLGQFKYLSPWQPNGQP